MRPLYEYYEVDSSLHRVHALVKLGLSLALAVSIVFWQKPTPPAVAFALVVGCGVAFGRLPLRAVARGLAPFVGIAFLWVVSTALFYAGEGRVWPQGLSGLSNPDAVRWGLTRALRMLCVVAGALVFGATTNPSDLLRALTQQRWLSYRLGFAALAGYRMLPLLATEYGIIRAAHRLRGVPEARGMVGRAQRLVSYGIPLLAGAVRRAE
ncbi:MAG: energy-coupling factor transporter transmembrane component T family protein, partial [Armatimonadota bacterium]